MLQFTKDPLPITNLGESHISAVLLVDRSGSMSGAPIEELNQGLIEFGNALKEDQLALGRAEVCIISFGSSVQTEIGFRPAEEYQAPTLSAGGLTSLNGAIEAGLDALEARKLEYREKGVSYYRPWLFLLTDGEPTDTEKEKTVKKRLKEAIRNKQVVYMPMGIGQANTAELQSYYPTESSEKPVLKADTEHFKQAFVWLSRSLSVVAQSDPNVSNTVKLPPTPDYITVGI